MNTKKIPMNEIGEELLAACAKELQRSIYCPGCGAKLATTTPGLSRATHVNCADLVNYVRLGFDARLAIQLDND